MQTPPNPPSRCLPTPLPTCCACFALPVRPKEECPHVSPAVDLKDGGGLVGGVQCGGPLGGAGKEGLEVDACRVCGGGGGGL
jgi:hypothetical protein